MKAVLISIHPKWCEKIAVKVFWSQGGFEDKHHGKPFEIIGRTPILDADHPNGAELECLPMWNIRFKDGFEMAAYPDEIIPREMRENGCPEKYLERRQL